MPSWPGWPGAPDVLELNDVGEPEVGAGQLLIKVAAAGVNLADIYRRAGTYPAKFPFVPGQEAAGTVVEIGGGVRGFSVGERVATAEAVRCYADYAVIDQEKALPVPAE